jgi:excisionase family DNA binding protein
MVHCSTDQATASPLAAPLEKEELELTGRGGEDMEDRLLYRVTEVAVFLNVSRSKVYELLASGDLRSVKIDRTRLVRGSDLRDYVESLGPVA